MVDSSKNLRPAAFLDVAQDLAVRGANNRGFGDNLLNRYDCCWVLARMQVRFGRTMRYEGKGTAVTWHKGNKGLYFLRDYRLLDESGEVLVDSTSSWILMNSVTRSIVRDEHILEMVNKTPESLENAIETPAPRIVMPRGAEPELVGEHKVLYSDVDFNNHVNNVRYSVWAMDCLPGELVFGHVLRELCINFNKEAVPGETVELYHHCAAPQTPGEAPVHIVEGRSGGHQVFIESLVFDERTRQSSE